MKKKVPDAADVAWRGVAWRPNPKPKPKLGVVGGACWLAGLLHFAIVKRPGGPTDENIIRFPTSIDAPSHGRRFVEIGL